MARVAENKQVIDFTKGWINKFNAVTGSDGNIRDIANIRTQDDGTLKRRLGIEKESSATEVAITATTSTLFPKAYLWTGADEDDDATVGIILGEIGGPIKAFSVTTSDMTANIRFNSAASSFKEVASYKDALVAGPRQYIHHDGTDPLNTKTTLTLEVRDFWGEPSTVGLEEHDTTATSPPDDLEYNLYNQGWTRVNIDLYQADANNTANEWPALNQIMFVGKDASDNFDYDQLIKTEFGSTQPSKGRFIINPHDRSGSRNVQVDDKEPSNAIGSFNSDVLNVAGEKTLVSGFGGRLVYAGGTNIGPLSTTAPSNAEQILITKVLQNLDDLSKCYQEADPTSETDSALVDDDGVVLQLAGCGQVFGLVESRGSMLFLCQRGIWQISGADGTFFTATSFRVNRVYNEGSNVYTPFVNVDGKVFFVNSAGVHILELNDADGLFVGQNLNSTLLGDYKTELPDTELEFIRMGYDEDKKELHIGFVGSGDVTFRRIEEDLIFNFNHNSVYKFTYNITETSNDFDAIVDFLYVPGRGFKYLLVHDYKDWVDGNNLVVYFGSETDATFEDLDRGSNTNDAAAFVNWWPETLDRTDIRKVSSFVYTQLVRSETGFTVVSGDATFINPGGGKLSYRWDWKTVFTTAKNIYITMFGETPVSTGDYTFPYEVNDYRSRIRGWGKALEIKIESEAGKELHILGYNIKLFGSDD